MKKPDYVMIFVATVSTLCTDEGQVVKRIWMEDEEENSTTFKYEKPFELHFKYQLILDHNNNLHHQLQFGRCIENWPLAH